MRSSLRSEGRWALSLAMCAAGCAHAPPVPAVLVTPDAQSRAELSSVIQTALGTPVTLAEDALTRSDRLSVDHPNVRDASGLPIDGRRRSIPDAFTLSLHDRRCVLTEARTNRRWTLSHARCAREQGMP